VVTQASQFSGDASQTEDVTVVVVKRSFAL